MPLLCATLCIEAVRQSLFGGTSNPFRFIFSSEEPPEYRNGIGPSECSQSLSNSHPDGGAPIKQSVVQPFQCSLIYRGRVLGGNIVHEIRSLLADKSLWFRHRMVRVRLSELSVVNKAHRREVEHAAVLVPKILQGCAQSVLLETPPGLQEINHRIAGHFPLLVGA